MNYNSTSRTYTLDDGREITEQDMRAARDRSAFISSSYRTFGWEVCQILGILDCQRISITHHYAECPRFVATGLIKDGVKLGQIRDLMKRYKLVPKLGGETSMAAEGGK